MFNHYAQILVRAASCKATIEQTAKEVTYSRR